MTDSRKISWNMATRKETKAKELAQNLKKKIKKILH